MGEARDAEAGGVEHVFNLESLLKTQEFAGRDANLVKELMANASVETFADDQVIFRENDDVDRLYFIQAGEVAICVDDEPIEKISSGKVIGLGAIFETLGLPVSVKAMASCDCRSVSKETFLSALRKYPEDENHLRSFADRLCKEETSRWEKRGALLRTKRKLKAISAMRNGRKLAVPGGGTGGAVAGGSQGSTESTFERQQSSNSKSSASEAATPRLLQDEARRRQKVQMIRAGLAQRAEAKRGGGDGTESVRTRRVRKISNAEDSESLISSTPMSPLSPLSPIARSQRPNRLLEEEEAWFAPTASGASASGIVEVDELDVLNDGDEDGLKRQHSQMSTGSELMASGGGKTRARRQGSGSISTRNKENREEGTGSLSIRRALKRSFLPVVPGAAP